MRSIRYGSLAAALLLLMVGPLTAQEEEGEALQRHRIGVYSGATFVPEGEEDGATKLIVVPTVGVDYDYKFGERFGVGLYNDLQLQSYRVQTFDDETVERDFAFATVLVAVVEATPWLEFYAGPGVELEKSENFWIIKVGGSVAPTFGGIGGASLEAYLDYKEEYISIGVGIKVAARL
jgi:hypothetical protein